ncbi:DNA circularization N-terminal domain-containing protein, partial [Candidatus Erwinia dacicola]
MANTINEIASALGVDLLMPASFRGVEFDCLFTRDTLAKDTVTYAYPYRDGEEVEPVNAVIVDLVFVESGKPDALFATTHYEADGDS